jgi:hypothetical protein
MEGEPLTAKKVTLDLLSPRTFPALLVYSSQLTTYKGFKLNYAIEKALDELSLQLT